MFFPRLIHADAYPGHWTEDYSAVELGFALIPSARGCGYLTEAARAVIAEAMKVVDGATIRAHCDIDNPKSAAVLLRCGMTELEPSGGHRRFERSLAPVGTVA